MKPIYSVPKILSHAYHQILCNATVHVLYTNNQLLWDSFLHSYVILSYAAGINNRRLQIGNDGFIADQASKYEQLPTN